MFRQGKFVFLFFLTFTLLICLKIIFKNEVLFTGDNFDLIFPQKNFWVSELKQGRIPLWNPYILSGTPYLADINLGTFSPTNFIYLLINPVERAGSLLFVLELFLAGFFTYLLSRLYNVSETGSVISGISFMCSGIILSYVTNLAIFNVAVFIPIILYILEIAFLNRRIIYFILVGILFALQILSGHVQITFYTGLLIIFLTIFKKNLNFKQKLIILLIIFIIGFGLSAVQLLPFLEFTRFTPRIGQGYQWATQGSLTPVDLIKSTQPKFVWNFVSWVDFSAKVNVGYIGVIPFALFLIGLFSKDNKIKKWQVIAIISLVIALGSTTFLYKIIYYLIPGFSAFRIPSQALVIYSFTSCLIAGKGYDRITHDSV